MGWRKAGWMLLAAGLWTASASAQRSQSSSVVTWAAPATCPQRGHVVSQIERLLGRPLDDAGPVRVRGHVRTDAAGFVLEMVLVQGDEESRRVLSDPSCDALGEASALVVALAIDPTVFESLSPEGPVESAPGREPTSATAPEETSSATPARSSGAAAPTAAPSSAAAPAASSGAAAPTAASSTAASSSAEPLTPPRHADGVDSDRALPEPDGPIAAPSSWRAVAQASAVLSLGPLPSVSGGGALAVGVGFDALELTLGGYALVPQQGQLADVASGGNVGLAAGRVRACLSVETGPVEVLPCGAFEVGASWATGVGVPVVRSGSAAWVALGAGVRARYWILDAMAVELYGELQVPLLRAPFVLTLDGMRREFHRAAEVSGLFGLGLAFRVR